MLEIEICEIRGRCPVHQLGHKIVIDGPHIVLEKTDALCIHALPTLLHYSVALDHGVDLGGLGIIKTENVESAYVQCVDPHEPYTGGGTVIFKCRRIVDEEI